MAAPSGNSFNSIDPFRDFLEFSGNFNEYDLRDFNVSSQKVLFQVFSREFPPRFVSRVSYRSSL